MKFGDKHIVTVIIKNSHTLWALLDSRQDMARLKKEIEDKDYTSLYNDYTKLLNDLGNDIPTYATLIL